MIRTVVVAVFMTLVVLLLGPPFILHSVITGSVDRLYHVALQSLRVAMRLGGIRVRVEGLENIPSGVCIFAANHVSNADPPAVVLAIPRRVALLAKKEIFRIPIVASALRLASIVPVDRTDSETARASVDKAIEHLKSGISFLVFPEGTRSQDGRLRPFKGGTFVMAIQAGAPVVPVSIVGTHRVMRKGKWAIHPGEAIVKFGLAVDASSFTLEQRGELLAKVHRTVAAGLPEDQQPAEP